MFMVLFLPIMVLGAVALTPQDAWAWGAGIHVAQGSFILANIGLIKPQVAAILSAYPMDYIYGCISADIFLGKGYRRRADHCHNWSVGLKTLEGAADASTKAYAFGYLTHLSADIIAHNYFIPNMMAQTPTSAKLGHVYWEFRADRFIKKKHWTLASKVVSMHNRANDTLIKQVMHRSRIRFAAKKMVFKRAVRLNDLIAWREKVETVASPKSRLTRAKIVQLNNCAINLAVDFLKHAERSICMNYDPVGTDNTIKARRLRKSFMKISSPVEGAPEVFPIPEAILSVRHVDHESDRL